MKYIKIVVMLGLFFSLKAQKNFDAIAQELKKSQATSLTMPVAFPSLFNKVSDFIKNVFNSFVLTNVKIEEKTTLPEVSNIAGYKFNGRASIVGTLRLGTISVEASVNVYEDRFKNNMYSFTIQLPQNYKISQLFPKLTILDKFSLPRPQFVIADFAHINNEGVSIGDGLNLVSLVDLAGPFKLFGELKNKAQGLQSVIVDMNKPVQLVGRIPLSFDAISFSVVIPIRLGLDFTQIKELPADFSKFLKKITTDNFFASISLKGSAQTISIQNGIQITLGVQPDPIVLQTFGTIDVTSGSFSFGGKLPNMIELGGLSLGDFGVEFFIDPSIQAALVAFGIPISGLGLRGRVDLGKAGAGTSLEVWTKIAFTSKVGVDAIFNVIAKNLDFGNLAYLFTQMAAKANISQPISKDAIPTLKINKISGKFAPWDGSIAGKFMDAGFAFQVDATLFDKDFGLLLDIKHKKLVMMGQGYMPPIKFESGGKTIFQFTGAGKDLQWGNQDDGPYVHFNFDARKPLQGAFAVSGMLEMPALNFKQKIDLLFARHRYQATIESNAVGFGIFYDINIDPIKWREMHVAFKFKNDFDQFLSKQAIPALNSLKSESSKKLSDIDTKIAQLSGDITAAQQQGLSAADQEIRNTQNTIANIKAKIESLKRECEDAPKLKKIAVCPRVGIELAKQGTELAKQEIYLKGLLKPGKEVIRGTTDVAQKTTQGLADAQILKQAVANVLTHLTQVIENIRKGAAIFAIKEASGEVNAQDIAAGKVPLIKKLVAQVSIPGQKSSTITLQNIVFDFKNPVKSTEEIARQLIQSVMQVQ